MSPLAATLLPLGTVDRQLDEAKRVLGLSQADLAHILGTTARTVSRWRSRSAQHVEPSGGMARKLRDIERLAFLLESDLGAGEAAQWLRRPNAALRGAAPLDIMLDGDYERVLGLVLSLGQGGLY